jgi:hypothetical protein
MNVIKSLFFTPVAVLSVIGMIGLTILFLLMIITWFAEL